MTTGHLHFDGPMVAGGLGYAANEIIAGPAPTPHSTGIEWLDQLSGGIEPGAVWTIAGPTGVGVTRLIAGIAVAAARSGDVLLANGHVGTRRLAALVGDAARRGGSADEATLPRVASWLPAPTLGEDRWDSACESADVVVLDTWDEMWRPTTWSRSREERIADARWFREVARANRTALVLSARLPRWTRADSDDGAPHWTQEALDDIADVTLELDWDTASGARRLTARVRGGGTRQERWLRP